MSKWEIIKPSSDTPPEEIPWRFYIVIGIIILMMGGLVLRLFQLQVIQAGFYRNKSTMNHVLEIPMNAPRGDIYDRNGIKLAQNHIGYDLFLSTTGDNETDIKHLNKLAVLAKVPQKEIDASLARLKKAQGKAPILLKRDITLPLVIEIKEKYDEYPFALIDHSPKRSYPYGELTSHIIGYIREIDESKLKGMKTAGYSPGDLVGWSGIERQYDKNLRGAAGRKLMEVDHRGNWMGLVKNWEENAKGDWELKDQLYPPEKGNDIHLTIDIDLQRQAAAALGENVGGVAIMDVHSGEILAMYSYPTFDSNLFTGPVMSVDWNEIINAPNNPLQNRLFQNAYPPGSIFKPIVAYSGFLHGTLTPSTSVTCRGALKVGNREFKCWKAGGHGTVNIISALAQSCDVFFYTIGGDVGIDNILEISHYLGFATDTGIDLPDEKPGFLPSPKWKEKHFKQKWYAGDTVNMSIGQGFLQVTPLQMLRAFAFLANGGKLVNPHLNTALMTRDETPKELSKIDPLDFALIRQGLRAAIVSGTAHRAYLPDIPIAGKTGSAQDPPRNKTHSWFVSFAPYDNPQVAMVVFGQNAGHSDVMAVPIAKKIWECREMKKYLQIAQSSSN
jgi:penicillin-binding protein 2